MSHCYRVSSKTVSLTSSLTSRPFDNDRICIIFYITTTNNIPWLYMRTLENGLSWVDILGAHELCIKRIRPSTLCLSKWDYANSRIKPWADLSFITWEGEFSLLLRLPTSSIICSTP